MGLPNSGDLVTAIVLSPGRKTTLVLMFPIGIDNGQEESGDEGLIFFLYDVFLSKYSWSFLLLYGICNILHVRDFYSRTVHTEFGSKYLYYLEYFFN